MKIQLTIITLFLSFWATAQVGIGNTDPKATLDITASNAATPSNTDGLLIPRVDEFPVTDPTAAQDGMMVFVTGAGIPSKGFYFWDNTGGSWVNVNNGGDAEKINTLFDGKSDNYGTNNGSSLFLGINTGLNDESSDNKNVGVGYQSLYSNTTGYGNIAVGSESLYSNTTGVNNDAVGHFSQLSSIDANQNVSIGTGTLQKKYQEAETLLLVQLLVNLIVPQMIMYILVISLGEVHFQTHLMR